MKYRLIKEYPGSPKLGHIDELNKAGHNNQGVYVQSMYDKNPEFWEKVVEKDYEIVSVITNNSKFIEKVYNQNATIEPYWKIHAIKRLSDGEIFTIGDKVDSTISDLGRCVELTGFKIQRNKLILGLRELGYCPLNSIIKPKIPLFTTKDGVDIFKRDKSWMVHKNTFTMFDGVTHYNENYHYDETDSANWWFSTKEAAQDYILYNKPCLSLNDILNLEILESNSDIELLKSLIKLKKRQQSV